MRKKLTHAVLGALACMFAGPALADGPGDAGPDVAAPPVRAAPLPPAPSATTPAPQGRSGIIPLNGDELTLNVPRTWRFYDAEEAYAFLQRNNAAAPAGTVLGLLAPANADIRRPGTWATVVSYDAIGYVQPETANGLGAENFEAQVREARTAQNRPFEGFAAAPAFDATTLNWAERAAAPGAASAADMRHEQRVLGRYGVAGLTSIGSADQLPAMTTEAERLRTMLAFPEGRRHPDFQAASDQVSTYTVPELVTGIMPAAAEGAQTASGGTGQTGFGGLSGLFPWIAGGVLLLAGAGYLMLRNRRRDDDDEEEVEEA